MLTDSFLQARHVLVATNGFDLDIWYVYTGGFGEESHVVPGKKHTYHCLFDFVELTG